MVELIAVSAAGGLVPLTIGQVALTEVAPLAITSVAPFNGAEKSVSAALKGSIGAAFPAPGRSTEGAHARAIWSGRGQALVLGSPLGDLSGKAAVSDQSDGWTVLSLAGSTAREILARLTPVDLRASVFGRGRTARSSLGHMMAVLTCTGEDSFEIMVMRSMTQTAIHEIKGAMERVSARGAP